MPVTLFVFPPDVQRVNRNCFSRGHRLWRSCTEGGSNGFQACLCTLWSWPPSLSWGHAIEHVHAPQIQLARFWHWEILLWPWSHLVDGGDHANRKLKFCHCCIWNCNWSASSRVKLEDLQLSFLFRMFPLSLIIQYEC